MISTLQSCDAPKELAPPTGDSRHESERLKLLLDMTNALISNLEPRDLLRAITASIRERMHSDTVMVWLPDAGRRQMRALTMDFPQGKGFLREDLLHPIEGSSVGIA